MRIEILAMIAANLCLAATFVAGSGGDAEEASFPVAPAAFIDGRFSGMEGIAFNGEGRLFVTADKALWEVSTDGEVRRITAVYFNVGLAPIGERDILVADFGEKMALREGENDDGLVLKVTPEGDVSTVALGIGDPNFIVVRKDGSLLVSDDFTSNIYEIGTDGSVGIFSQAIAYPNGMVLSQDGESLFVAQIFRSIAPVEFDDRLWRLPLENGKPAGEPEMVFATGGIGGNDGLAMDEHGRVYIAANREGRIWRVDPIGGDPVLIAEGMVGAASLACGEGEFDSEALYVTSGRDGKLWKVGVGVEGAVLYH